MKVKDFVKKVNYKSSKLPVYTQEGIYGEPRKIISFDYSGYPFDEQDRTVTTISILEDKIIVYYK